MNENKDFNQRQMTTKNNDKIEMFDESFFVLSDELEDDTAQRCTSFNSSNTTKTAPVFSIGQPPFRFCGSDVLP